MGSVTRNIYTMQRLAGVEFNKHFEFRPARLEDTEEIKALFQAAHEEYGFEADFNGRDDDLNNVVQAYAHPRAFFGVLIDNRTDQLVGFAAVKHLSYKTAELARLYLWPHYRGMRLGKKMLDAVMSLAKKFGYDQLYVETHSYLKEAGKLYRKNGFKTTEALREVDPRYTDTIMIRSLQNVGRQPQQKQYASRRRTNVGQQRRRGRKVSRKTSKSV